MHPLLKWIHEMEAEFLLHTEYVRVLRNTVRIIVLSLPAGDVLAGGDSEVVHVRACCVCVCVCVWRVRACGGGGGML